MHTRILQLLASACILVLSPGCNKAGDYIEDNPDAVLSSCQVQQITTTKDWLAATYKYNKYGDPESVVYDFTSTETPNYLFKYDNRQRLVQCIEYFNQGNVFLWSKYFYDDRGLIISDSTWATGLLVNGQVVLDEEAGAYLETKDYTYDASRRIKTITVHYPTEPDFANSYTYEYFYDARGNRQDDSGNLIEYDNHINIHRTSKVFMFVDREYSLNSPVGPATYNKTYLPLTYGTSERNYLLKANLQNAVVTYKCK